MVSDTERTAVGGRVATVRKECGLNQRDLAQLTGVEQSQISVQENGKNRVQIDLLLVLVLNFKVNANWLLTGKGPHFRGETEGEVLEIGTVARGDEMLFKVIQKLEDLDDRLRAVEKK